MNFGKPEAVSASTRTRWASTPRTAAVNDVASIEGLLENLTREQDKFRQQLAETWGADPFKAMEAQTKRNMAMFSDALKMFNPMAASMMNQGAAPEAHKPASAAGSRKDDLQDLKDQISAMQRKLDTIVGEK